MKNARQHILGLILLVGSFSFAWAVGPLPSAATALPISPMKASQDCTGCLNTSTELNMEKTCNGCTMRVYVEVSQYVTNCLTVEDCDKATCKQLWKIKYKTTEAQTGDCAGKTWTLERLVPKGSSLTIQPTTGSAQNLARQINYDELCGNWTTRHYKLSFDAPECTEGDPPHQQEIDTGVLQIGCSACAD